MSIHVKDYHHIALVVKNIERCHEVSGEGGKFK